MFPLLALAAALLSLQTAWAEPTPAEPPPQTPTTWGSPWWSRPQQPALEPQTQPTPSAARWPGWSTSGWTATPTSGWSSVVTPDRALAERASSASQPTSAGERRIQVIIRHNLATVEAFEGERLVRTSHGFGGLPEEPTPLGEFEVQGLLGTLRTTIWQARSGHEWDLPYFVQFADDYGFHGPMLDPRTGAPSLTFTAGCLALTFEDARWLYEWVTPGTPIRIVSLAS